MTKAIDNDDNLDFKDLTTKQITEEKLNILTELGLNETLIKSLMDKLKEYRYIDEIHKLKLNRPIRYIPLIDPTKIKLKNPSTPYDIVITDTGINLKCKCIFSIPRTTQIKMLYFSIIYDNNIVFQKLTPEELIILKVTDYLDTS